jgi:hypothetical protein
MDYDDSLTHRRKLIATVVRDGFRALFGPEQTGLLDTVAIPDQQPVEASLRELVDSEILKPGDLLDPLDPDWVIDAVISAKTGQS